MNSKKKYLVLIFSVLLGCGPKTYDFLKPAEGIQSGTWLTYEGTLPCADCSEIKMSLQILIDYNNPTPPFIIKQAYFGAKDEDRAITDHGVYGTLKTTFRNSDATAYELNPGNETKHMVFLRVHDDTLKMLDKELREIDSKLNYLLIRKK
jgi:copper homeostasis protein (lipoprotein)